MSLRTLPILFFNLGGEMLYILDQRLRAQNVTTTKAQQVVQDIASQMFEPNCVKELFRPQKVVSMKSLRQVFTKLAHSSIMKLNTAAMEKLCDLMIMAVKYQFVMCRRGEDIVLVTLNHLDTIRKLVGDSKVHLSLLDAAIKTTAEYFGRFQTSDFFLLRTTLLSVFQDVHKRVSIFLKKGCQNTVGHFILAIEGPVPNGVEVPGTIRYYDDEGAVVRELKFYMPLKYEEPEPPGSWAVHGDRVITLGLNMYAGDKIRPAVQETQAEREGPGKDVPITAELAFLERLLRITTITSSDTFKLDLFLDDSGDELEEAGKADTVQSQSKESRKDGPEILRIDPTKAGNDALEKIAKDFLSAPKEDVSSGADDDLLNLLDQAL